MNNIPLNIGLNERDVYITIYRKKSDFKSKEDRTTFEDKNNVAYHLAIV